MICTSYQAGHRLGSRADTATAIGGIIAYMGVLLVFAGPAPPEPWTVTARAVVLIVLPIVAGRYHAQHQELIAALRQQGELSAERERLRVRLRIARDMHDSLGHRLGLVSVQAAALEVARLPDREHQAMRQLADAVRKAMDELHELVGTLRRPDEDGTPGLSGIGELVTAFRRAGLVVAEERSGDPRPLPGVGGEHAAYRVVQEGLTNTMRHAPGERVTVTLDWQPDALLVSVVNPTTRSRTEPARSGGTGLTGLEERVRLAGGLLHVHDFGRGVPAGRDVARPRRGTARTRRCAMIRVLVADDEALVTAGIRAVLESAGDIEVAAEAADGRQAMEAARRHRIDVALIDIAMPVMDGLAVARELRGPRVVMLTAFGEERNVRLALRHGVAGFVLKN